MRRPWALLLSGAAVLAALKLVLVGRDEIVAVFGVHDQLRFAEMAQALAAGDWLGRYDQMTLIRRPAYPLWLWLSGMTGVPQRVAIEILLIASALALGTALHRSGLSWPMSLAAFGAVTFAPPSLELNDHLLAEAFVAPVQAMSLACSIALLAAKGARERVALSVTNALCLAAMAEARPERVLVWAQVAVLLVTALWLWHAGGRKVGRPVGLAAVVLVPPVLCVGGASAAVAAVNLSRYGVFTSNEMFDSGFSAAWRALQRIRQDPARPFVSVPSEARRKAYAVSPTLRRLEPLIEDQLRPSWTVASCEAVSVCDDYADGWFPYLLRDAAAAAGEHADARRAEAMYRAVADEIGAACGDGRLPCRSIAGSWLHVHLLRGLPRLPGSLARVALFLSAAPYGSLPQPANLSEAARAAFDQAALRRSALIPRSTWRVSGWVFSDAAPIDEVLLLDGRGRMLASSSPRLVRPDVAAVLQTQGVVDPPVETGFTLAADAGPDPGPMGDGFLVFRRTGRGDVVLRAREGACNHETVRCAIDSARGQDTRPAGLTRSQLLMAAGFGELVAALTFAAAFAAAVVLWRWHVFRPDPVALGALAILASAVACRVVAIALVDAAFFPASPRYVYPVVGSYLSALILLIGMASRALRAERRAGAASR